YVGQRKPANPVVIGGDVHSFWVTDLKPDFDDERAPVVASEVVGTSITSCFSRTQSQLDAVMPENPHVRFATGAHRGYVRVEVSTSKLGRGGIAAETRQVGENLGAVLEAAGSPLDKVVKVTIYMADLAELMAMNEAFSRYFPVDPPARTTFQCVALVGGARV